MARVSNLLPIRGSAGIPSAPEFYLSDNTSSPIADTKMRLGDLAEQIKAELGYYKDPLKKCKHCGQWGAVMCACVSCGAPIDP